MFQEDSSNKRKKRKKSVIFCYNVFLFLIFLSIPFLYKIYFSSYIKTLFNFQLKVKALDKYIPHLKEIYLILFNKYYLQLLIPLLLIYNYCNIYKTFIFNIIAIPFNNF